MSGFLLDTNVLSELRRPRPVRRVVDFVSAQPLTRLHVSVVTLAEIRFGIERLTDIERRTELTDWLDHRVRPMFSDRVLTVDEDVMLRWRMMVEAARQQRRTPSQPDLIIAATAAHHGLTVVTRDKDEFARAGVPVLDPWDGT